jgi:hypothetical protein
MINYLDEYKIKLLANFFAKSRIINDTDLDKLLELDDKWKEIYQEFRIKKGFLDASLLANEAVIKIVYEEI